MSTQNKTEFFESIIEDKNVPAALVQNFFHQAYKENERSSDEQLRLLELLAQHRPELEGEVAKKIIRG